MTQAKYLKYKITTRKAGLNHQTYNLKTLFSESHITGRIAVVSNLYLFGFHNNKKELYTDLSQYYDFRKVTVCGEPITVIQESDLPEEINQTNKTKREAISEDEQFVTRVFPPNEGCSWIGYDEPFPPTEINIPFTQSIIDQAKEIIDKIGAEFASVHVRRRDVLKNHWRAIFDTRPKNIIKVLQRHNSPQKVYIMSDEPKKDFFSPISEFYDLYTYRDFEQLNQSKEVDNYRLYCIEKCIRNFAKFRVSTFDKIGEEDSHAFLTSSKW